LSNRKLRIYDEYRYGPRSVLLPGDRFRVSGGPVYVTGDGTVVPMAERGELIFRRYCVRGAAKWIEAHRADGGGIAVLWMGRTGRSKAVPGLRRRPYRITRKIHKKRSPGQAPRPPA